MGRLFVAALLLIASEVGSEVAAAEPTRVVVLPFVTTETDLVIYGKPVADAVARGLHGDGLVIEVGAGQTRSDLVVELRVSRPRRKVQIEASVRDSDTGATIDSVSGKATALADLDVAAGDLAKALAQPVAAAAAARRARIVREAEPQPPAPAPVTTVPDARPAIVVYQPDGPDAGGTIPVRPVATRVVVDALATIGYRAIISGNVGVAPPDVAAASARVIGARATLMLYVYAVEFQWLGVLTARGHLRLIAVAPDRRVLLDRDLDTDTLVGSRGDRHDALVRFVLRQAMQMSQQELTKALQ